jgi:hypothetical protein
MSDRFRDILYVKPEIVVVRRIIEKAIEDAKHRKSNAYGWLCLRSF